MNSETTEREWSAHGKWILAGEHSVLRGCPALVFPFFAGRLRCRYTPSREPLTVEFGGREGEPLKLLFWGVVENALERTGHTRRDLTGHLRMDNDLPFGTGLGASAALCVAIGQWWRNLGWIDEYDLYEFSRELENMFHGESSGVDIAAAMADTGIRFLRGGERSRLVIQWQPLWYLSYCGSRGVTAECVKRVKSLKDTHPGLFDELDGRMRQAVELAEKALASDEMTGLPLLTSALHQAAECFQRWGLIEGDLEKHIRQLQDAGAVAVKPTGSGGGGYVLSLWRSNPPDALTGTLTPLNGFSPNM